MEGDQADGYVIHKISDSMMNAAGGEVCEAAVKMYIETTAIELFYHEDGSSYASYNPEDFPIMDKYDNAEYEELYKEIIKMAKFN